MESNKIKLDNGLFNGQYPSINTYNMIFYTGLIIATVTIILSLIILGMIKIDRHNKQHLMRRLMTVPF